MNSTIKSANFDSIVGHDAVTGLPTYDRPLRGEDVRQMYQMIISNGVYVNPSTSFQVIADEDAGEVVVKAGYAWINGSPVWDLEDDAITLEPAASTNPRIDIVVLRWDNTLENRNITKAVKTGTASASPVAPELTRNADVYEICLAQIYRPVNTSVVTQTNVTDTRGDDNLCGWVHGVVEQVDTTTIWNQYSAWLQEKQEEWDDWWSSQQEVSGYMTTASEYTNLDTTDKTVIGAINEVGADVHNNYLPLSAGRNKPLSDSLYVDNTASSTPSDFGFFIKRNGTHKGECSYDLFNGCTKVAGLSDAGVRLSQMRLYSNGRADLTGGPDSANRRGLYIPETASAVRLISQNGIELHPNGSSNSQMATLGTNGDLTVNGDVLRTPKTMSASQVASMSLSAGNNKVCGITNIPAGVYLVSANTHIVMSSANNAYINLYKSTSASTKIVFDNHYIKASSSWINTVTWVTCQANAAISFYVETTSSCTVDNAYLEIVRIG